MTIGRAKQTANASTVLQKKGFLFELKKNKVLFLMLVPTLVFFVVNDYIPMVGIYYAFTKYDFRGGLFGSKFVGLQNFEYLFKSGTLMTITRNTILYNIVFIVIGNFMEILVAILVSRMVTNHYKKVLQSLTFLPYFVSSVILGVLVYNFFNYDHGMFNAFRAQLGMSKVDVYNAPGYWPVIITAFYIWTNLGYGMVVYLASVMGIGDEFYEAAEIDGANVFKQIRYITLPMLKPTFITLFLFALGGIMHGQFDLFYQLVGNNGVLFKTTDIIDTYVYRSLISYFDVGLSTAAGVYQSVFGFILIMIVNTVVRHINEDYALF